MLTLQTWMGMTQRKTSNWPKQIWPVINGLGPKQEMIPYWPVVSLTRDGKHISWLNRKNSLDQRGWANKKIIDCNTYVCGGNNQQICLIILFYNKFFPTNVSICWLQVWVIWRFPGMGLPPVIIHFMFPEKNPPATGVSLWKPQTSPWCEPPDWPANPTTSLPNAHGHPGRGLVAASRWESWGFLKKSGQEEVDLNHQRRDWHWTRCMTANNHEIKLELNLGLSEQSATLKPAWLKSPLSGVLLSTSFDRADVDTSALPIALAPLSYYTCCKFLVHPGCAWWAPNRTVQSINGQARGKKKQAFQRAWLQEEIALPLVGCCLGCVDHSLDFIRSRGQLFFWWNIASAWPRRALRPTSCRGSPVRDRIHGSARSNPHFWVLCCLCTNNVPIFVAKLQSCRLYSE